jgi:peptidyl-prolyl cis-trans isomerase A (cyclophilin A)
VRPSKQLVQQAAWKARLPNLGSFVIELYPDYAPKTVANFLQYVNEGFYDGTLFHRLV